TAQRILIEGVAFNHALEPANCRILCPDLTVEMGNVDTQVAPGSLDSAPYRNCPIVVAILGQWLATVIACRLLAYCNVYRRRCCQLLEALEIDVPLVRRAELDPAPLGDDRR